MNDEKIIAVAGHICLDITPKIASQDTGPLKAGSLYACNGVDIALGGATANTGMALKKLGNDRVPVFAKIGRDQFGATIQEILETSSLENVLSFDDETASSYSVIIAKKGVDRIFFHDPGANNTFDSTCVRVDSLEAVSLLHFGYPPMMKAVREENGLQLKLIFSAAKNAGVTTSLDMCMPDMDDRTTCWPKLLEQVLSVVDVFIPSVEESLYMIYPDRYRRIMQESGSADFVDYVTLDDLHALGTYMMDANVAIAPIKCGKRGYYLRTNDSRRLAEMGRSAPANLDNWANRELFIPAVTVPSVLSATGAGDVSIAGFLKALTLGETAEDTLAIASASGAQATQSYDAVSAVPTYQEIRGRIANQMYDETLPLMEGWLKRGHLLFGPEDCNV